jgi:ribosomal protein S18 acetylase RimI-like enzyme
MNEDDLSFQICKMPDDSKSAEDGRRAVLEGLLRFNKNKTSNMEPPKAIPIFIRDRKGRVVGGVIGYVYAGWLHIDLLWIEESFRNRGNGTKLLKMIENEAVKCGCKYVDLDTFSFQARTFYEKHGYTLFATLDNYPEGHSKHFLKKKLP